MKLKLYALIPLLISGIFSQRKKVILYGGGLLEDPVVDKIVDAYGNKPEKPKETFIKNSIPFLEQN
jgi:hypothetical protein